MTDLGPDGAIVIALRTGADLALARELAEALANDEGRPLDLPPVVRGRPSQPPGNSNATARAGACLANAETGR